MEILQMWKHLPKKVTIIPSIHFFKQKQSLLCNVIKKIQVTNGKLDFDG